MILGIRMARKNTTSQSLLIFWTVHLLWQKTIAIFSIIKQEQWWVVRPDTIDCFRRMHKQEQESGFKTLHPQTYARPEVSKHHECLMGQKILWVLCTWWLQSIHFETKWKAVRLLLVNRKTNFKGKSMRSADQACQLVNYTVAGCRIIDDVNHFQTKAVKPMWTKL